jgi:hypothetical protein
VVLTANAPTSTRCTLFASAANVYRSCRTRSRARLTRFASRADLSKGSKATYEKDGCDLMFVVNIHLIQRSFAVRVQPSDLELAG